jgi:hypothetical protein
MDIGTGAVCGAIFGAVMGMFPAIYISTERRDYYGKIISKAYTGLSILILMGCIVVGAIIGSTFPAPYNYFTLTPIYSAGDAIGTSGTFVLGSGTISTDPVFIYYIGNDTVGYTLDYKSSSKSRIFMDEDIAPYIKNNCAHDLLYTYDICTYEFHVPHNAVRKIFSFDLGKE